MNRFGSIDELRVFLRKDRDEVSLCPLRFINVDSMEMWVSVKQLLLSMSKNHICLSSFCSQEDTTPNMRRLTIELKTLSESACVSPLSEYLRVNPDIAKSTIEDLIAKEYVGNSDGKLRIYIPMYRMKSILQTVTNTDPRKKDCILLVSTGEESDYSLTVIQKNLQVSLIGNEIYGFKQYLQYWEQNPDKPLILHTDNAVHFEGKVFFDNVHVIVTSFDLLSTYYHLPSIYSEADGTIEDWDRLAEVVASEQSFEGACCHELLINKFTQKLFDKWPTLDGFSKWLLWLWAKDKPLSGYLGLCLRKSSSPESFQELLSCDIIKYLGDPHFSDYYRDRKAALAKMQILLPSLFWAQIDSLPAIDRLRILTDGSVNEREAIFRALHGISESNRGEATLVIATSYPALGRYLLDTEDSLPEDIAPFIVDYFAQYRWNKAANVLPSAFVDVVNTIAKQKGESVFALKARNLIVDEEYDSNTAILFADGMGVEYVNYLYSSLSQLKAEGYHIRSRIGYCNLPSTTAINKDFLQGKRVALELSEPDEMKHGKTSYPQTIENELSFLDRLKDKVRSAFSSDVSRVILTTDHGTSRMAVLVRSTEFDNKLPPKGHPIYKYGRYCEGTDMADEIPTAIEYDGKLIFADYQRFDQKGAPIDETHGGASLEEWLVPVIVIDNTVVRKAKVVISVKLTSDYLRPDSMTKMVTVRFTLDHNTDSDVSVRIHGKKIVCKPFGAGFEFKYLPEKGENEISTKVYWGSESIGAFSFHIKQGIAQNKNFDLI